MRLRCDISSVSISVMPPIWLSSANQGRTSQRMMFCDPSVRWKRSSGDVSVAPARNALVLGLPVVGYLGKYLVVAASDEPLSGKAVVLQPTIGMSNVGAPPLSVSNMATAAGACLMKASRRPWARLSSMAALCRSVTSK